jgi:hypothetical protein
MRFQLIVAVAFVSFSVGVARGAARSVDAPTRMERTAPYILGYCKQSRILLRACPHLLPRMAQPSPHWDANLCLVGRAGCRGLTWDDLSLVDAGYGARPPVWSHVLVWAGNLEHAFGFRFPRSRMPRTKIDGLFAASRTRPIYVDTRTWGGREGILVLAPAFPVGGEQGDHLIFRWHGGTTDFAVSLHGWEPFSQTLAALRRMVLSIPRE